MIFQPQEDTDHPQQGPAPKAQAKTDQSVEGQGPEAQVEEENDENNEECPVCSSRKTMLFLTVYSYDYYHCRSCQVLFISPEVLAEMDKGNFLITYNEKYWDEELKSARERAWGQTMARTAEVLFYARIPVRKFIDIGSGPGYFLDAINYQLPSSEEVFYAAELFPPADEWCTKRKNYHRGSLLNLPFSFDAGSCIEVIEHITPKMLQGMFSDMAKKSVPNSIYIFNTGMVDYIIHEDIKYLDPLVRGHVMGWSIPALQHIAEPLGFSIQPIPGKTWAFLVEYQPDHGFEGPVTDRIWSAQPENLRILRDPKTGNLMEELGRDTVRAYC
jgi:hypothetical protein